LFEGALATWKWFAVEVTDQSLNDGLLSCLYIPVTNDANESGLLDLRQLKIRAPNASLEYNNSRMMLKRNGTARYVEDNLMGEEDQKIHWQLEHAEQVQGNGKKRQKLIAD
ncbi:hypothetical protein F5880DRAFT_1438407, partial [Lentinula raphanica]